MPFGARLADVGTDHGYLPVYLIQHHMIESAVATDIRPGPLARAKSCVEENEISQMRCILCNGLDAVDPSEADTVVIAGMGGENIADILQRAIWTRENTTLILQPMSRAEVLRMELSSLGLCTEGEYLVEDSGRLYSILVARGGKTYNYSESELYTGRYEQIKKEALFPTFLKELEKKLLLTCSGLARSAKPEDVLRLQKNRIILEQIKAMEENHYAEGI